MPLEPVGSVFDEARLERALARRLHVPVRVGVATQPAVESDLTAAERARCERLHGPRRDAWLRGRAALKRLLRLWHGDTDTAGLDFPHAQLSLTHADGAAVAVGTRADVGGLGVDLERGRALRAGSERFFLDESERAWLATLDAPRRGRTATSSSSRPRAGSTRSSASRAAACSASFLFRPLPCPSDRLPTITSTMNCFE